ncbi:CRAL-TRIO domain-containing protein [Rhodocollybia butyracea]|uniref:CRAL-TRIO domain-containing protein n=1 Tax=Rhodocollybia butyracea TaxID=206335 RepID=A0A9P5Q3X8_9AGAR|nr:CRAL-TRIO domain-containing protein [Rhodocollybia butyracea]
MSRSSESETVILERFREELFSEGILHSGDTIGSDDGTLKRFLRARKFSIKDAKRMFIEAQDWRKQVNLDELYSKTDPFDYPEREAVFGCWPMWFHKLGRPLNFQSLGGLDLERLGREGVTPERHWETVLVNAECLTREIIPAAIKKHGRDADSVFVIVDLKGFGLAKFWQMKHLAQRCFQISQDYYPETMGKLAIINAPSTFTLIWNVIRPWLAKETANKVDILGSDYQEKLLELVDAENLPSILGGNCRCEEEGSLSEVARCHLSASGPWLEGRIGWGPHAKPGSNSESTVSDKPESDTSGALDDGISRLTSYAIDSDSNSVAGAGIEERVPKLPDTGNLEIEMKPQ